MKSECCHGHPDNGELATQTESQRAETDLRAVNAKLLAALEKIANPQELPDKPQCECYWDSGVRLEQCEAHDPEEIARAVIGEANK